MLGFFKKKHARQDDVYIWCVYALADTFLMCDATGNPFNGRIFSNKVIERIEKAGFLLSQSQANQIKQMRDIVISKKMAGQLNGIFEMLRDAHSDNLEKIAAGGKSDRGDTAPILFCAAYLEKEFRKDGLNFSFSASMRDALDETYSMYISAFTEALKGTAKRV